MPARKSSRVRACSTFSLDDPYPESLRELTDAELIAVVTRFDGTTEDWSVFEQRMRYIVRLFRCFQEQPSLNDAPFTPAQVELFEAGTIPDGKL